MFCHGVEAHSPPVFADLDPLGGGPPSGATRPNVTTDPHLNSVIRNNSANLQVDSCHDNTTTAVVDPDRVRERKARREAARRALAQRIRDRRDQRKAALERLKAPAARRQLSEFVRQAWHVLHPGKTLEWSWHLDVVCDHVQVVAGYLLRAREQHELGRRWEMPAQNLLINVPPRSLKTEIVGVFLPAWLWLKDPSLHVRYVSGNERVRTATSRMNRDLIGSKWYREAFGVGWHVRSDADAIGLFENTCRGRAYWSSYEQKITGEGTDLIIVDDPLDAQKAPSELERTSVNSAWDMAIENRVNDADRAARIGIMQRLHEEDWSAHVLSKGTWRHVCLPTEYEHPVPAQEEDRSKAPCVCQDCMNGKASFLGAYDRRTNEGEILHPARMSERRLEEERAKGSLYYAGQHQQRPAPTEGGMFKRIWWGSFDPATPPRFRRLAIFVDCSSKKTATGSRTAIGVIGEGWGADSGRRYVLEVVAKPMDITDMKRVLVGEKRAKDAHAPVDPGSFLGRYPRAALVIEDKAAGSDVIVELKAVGINVIAWDPKNSSKESRAFSSVGVIEAGDVLLARGAAWKDAFLHELSLFPNGKWDDQVDMLSMGLSYFRGERALKRTHL